MFLPGNWSYEDFAEAYMNLTGTPFFNSSGPDGRSRVHIIHVGHISPGHVSSDPVSSSRVVSGHVTSERLQSEVQIQASLGIQVSKCSTQV